MKTGELLVINTVYVDGRDDEVLLIKKIELLLSQIKKKYERVVILICDEERIILNEKGGKDEPKK